MGTMNHSRRCQSVVLSRAATNNKCQMTGCKSSLLSSSSFVCIVIVFFLAQLLFDATKFCESQKPITLNQHHQQQQQQTNGTNPSRKQQPQQQQTTQMLYQNASLAMSNRPLERPSLNLVDGGGTKPSATNRDGLAHQQFPEGASDWFMLSGGGGDLHSEEGRQVASFDSEGSSSSKSSSKTKNENYSRRKSNKSNRTSSFDDEQPESSDSNEIFDDVEGDINSLAGTQKEPECASHGRYYCTYKEDYPLKLVTEVTKYYKWPLEKLFRDLHAQIMPKLAQDSTGNLVCDSITRVVRPGWARNTNDRWLVVINTDNYHQYVTEVVCQYGTNSRCNFIPPCYYSSCQQRYNTQKLLVIDPSNPYRGPFLSEFLFPSCCVCYVPSASESFQDKYKPSPATIYQRTMQQEAAANISPPQFRPPGIIEDLPAHLADQSTILARTVQANGAPTSSGGNSNNQGATPDSISGSNTINNNNLKAPGIGEIRRGGDQYRGHHNLETTGGGCNGGRGGGGGCSSGGAEFGDFPRLGLADSMISQNTNRDASPEVRQ